MFQFTGSFLLGVSPFGFPRFFFSPLGFSILFRPFMRSLVFPRSPSFTFPPLRICVDFNHSWVSPFFFSICSLLRIRRLELLWSTWKADSLNHLTYIRLPYPPSPSPLLYGVSFSCAFGVSNPLFPLYALALSSCSFPNRNRVTTFSRSLLQSPEVTGGLCEQNCFFHHNSLLCDYYRILLPRAFSNQIPYFFSFSPLIAFHGSLPFVLVTVAHVSP